MAVLLAVAFSMLMTLGLTGGAWAATADKQAQNFTGKASFTTVWADNNDEDAARPATDDESLTSGYIIQWKAAGSNEWATFDLSTAAKEFGLTDDQVKAIASSETVTVSGQNYVFSVSNLPTSYVDAKTHQTVNLQFKVVREGEVEGYSKLAKGAYDGAFDSAYYGSNESIECLQRMEDVKYGVIVRDGSGVLQERYTLDEWNAAFGNDQTESVHLNNTVISTGAVADETSTISVDGNIVTISTPRPKYYPDNSPLDYSMVHDADATLQIADNGTIDYYQVDYSNANVPNHSSNITAAYNGGYVSLTHAGTVDFQATKYWYDNGSTDRPETTYSLYRYTTNGGSVAVPFQNCVVSAGAKTGTAQIGGSMKNGVFVAFAPYDDPEIAVALVLEKADAGAVLASTAVDIINAYFSREDTASIVPENQLIP